MSVYCYTTLNSASRIDTRLSEGNIEVWFKKSPDSFIDYGTLRALKGDLTKTHVLIGFVSEVSAVEIYDALQSENWSANGEADVFMKKLGLNRTSMGEGDIVINGNNMFILCDDSFLMFDCNAWRAGRLK